MIKRYPFLLLILTVALIYTGPIANADNLANPRFDTGDLSFWDSWTSNQNITAGVQLTQDRRNNDNYAAYLTLNGGGYAQGTISQGPGPSPVRPGQIINFGGFFKTANLTGAAAYIRFDYRDAGGNWLGIIKDVNLNLYNTTAWEFKSASDMVPNDSRIGQVNYAVLLMGDGLGTVYFDDIMSPVPEPVQVTSYITDPGFETGDFNFWEHWESNQNITAGITTTEVRRGSYTAYFTLNGGGDAQGTITQGVASVLPGQAVSFGAFFKTVNFTGGSVAIRFDYRDVNGGWLGILQDVDLQLPSNMSDWQFKSASHTVPSDSRIGKVYYTVFAQGNGTGSVYFDDVICPVIFPEKNILLAGEILDNFDDISDALTWQSDSVYALDRNNNQHYRSRLSYRGIPQVGFLNIEPDSRPRAMKVDYAKTQASQKIWMTGLVNMEGYDYLSFWIYNSGEPISFAVTLEDTSAVTWDSGAAGVTLQKEISGAGWVSIVLPLDKITGSSINLSSVKSIGFIADPGSSSSSGTFWVDDIMLSRAPNNVPVETFEAGTTGWSLSSGYLNMARSTYEAHKDWYYPDALGQASLYLEWTGKPADYSYLIYDLTYNSANAPQGRRGNYPNLKLNNNRTVELWAKNPTSAVIPILLKFDSVDVGIQYLNVMGDWQRLTWDYSQISSASSVSNIYIIPFPGQASGWGSMYIDDLNFTDGIPPLKIQPPFSFAHDAGRPDNDGTFTLSWSCADNATSYEIQESTVSDFSTFSVYPVVGTSKVISHNPATEAGVYYYRIRSVYSQGGTTSYSSFSAPSSAEIQSKRLIQLGVINSSDSEFLSRPANGYPTTPINLDTQTAADFPKELNIWEPKTTQEFYFTLTENDVSQGLVFKLTPAWIDVTWGSFNVALDIRRSKGWEEAAVREIGGGALAFETAKIAISPDDLQVGRNDFRLRIVSANGPIQVFTWDQILIESGGVGTAHNLSQHTLCAEEDNGNVPVYFPGSDRYRLIATQPVYLPTEINVSAPNFDYGQHFYNPYWIGADYNKVDLNPQYEAPVTLFDNGQIFIKAEYMWSNWLPANSMTITCAKGSGVDGEIINASVPNAQYLQVGRKVPNFTGWPQIIGLYADGNLRPLPHPFDPVKGSNFATSVLIGPAKGAGRPSTPISGVDVTILGPCPAADNNYTFLKLFITFADGSTANTFVTMDDSTGRPYMVFDFEDITSNTEARPITTVRSMWVRDGMSDSDRIVTSKGYFPFFGWDKLTDKTFWFTRELATYKNTNSPDIRIENLDSSTPYLKREAESYNRVADGWYYNNHWSASAKRSLSFQPTGGWAEYDISLGKPLVKGQFQVRYADDVGGNIVTVYVDGVEKGNFIAMSTGGWEIYRYSRKVEVGDLTAGNHTIKIATNNQAGCYGVTFDYLELVSYAEPKEEITLLTQQGETGVSGSGYVIGNWSNAIGGQSVDIGGTGTGGTVNYTVNADNTQANVYMKVRYSQAIGLSEVNVLVDGVRVATFGAESTGGWNTFRNSGNVLIGDLTAGSHQLSFQVPEASDNGTVYFPTKGAAHIDQFELFINSPILCDVKYLNPPGYDENGRALWYIGQTMNYEVLLRNITKQPISNLIIQAVQEYFEDKTIGNTLTNAGFETGTLPPWGTWYSNSNVTGGVENTVTHSGSYAGYLTLSSAGYGQGTIYQGKSNILPGQNISFGAYFKTLDLTGSNVAIRFDYRDSNGGWLGLLKDVDLSLSGTTDWQYKAASDVVPNDSRIAQVNYTVFLQGTLNKIENVGFETGSLSPWGSWYSNSHITGGVTNTQSHGGTYSSYLTLSGGDYGQGAIYQTASSDITPGQAVDFGAYFKALNLSGGSVAIRFDYRDVSGGYLGVVKDVNLNLSGTTDWQFKSASDIVPSNPSIAKVNYTVFMQGALNQLGNADFETGSPSPWGSWYSNSHITGGVTNTQAHGGTYSSYLTLSGGGYGQGTIYQTASEDVAPGQNVDFGAYFKTLNLSGGSVAIRFDYRDVNGGWLGIIKDVTLGLSGTTDWQFKSASDTVPSDSRIAKVNYTVFMEGSGSGTVYFDDAKSPVNSGSGTVYFDDAKSPLSNGSGTVYFDDAKAPDVPEIIINKGDPLPGASAETFTNQTIPANGTLVLSDGYYIPPETYPGLDQTHVNITQSGLELYNNPEVGVWCPPVPTPKISGKVTLQGRTDQAAQITFELRKPGQTNAVHTFQVLPESDGNYTLYVLGSVPIPEGTYDLAAKGTSTLRVVKKDIKVTNGKITSSADFTLLNGDADNNNIVSGIDFAILRAAYGTKIGDPKWDIRADFNGNGQIDGIDFSVLRSNYGKSGAQ